jgi:starch synthase
MHIFQIAPEMAPMAKVGGLADVVLGLSRALIAQGHTVDVIIPKYDCIEMALVDNLHIAYRELWSYFDGRWHPNTVWAGTVEGITVYFLECHGDPQYFERGRFYGCEDDIARFLYFSRAVLEYLLKADIQPDILHIHDWQTAVVAPLWRDIYHDLGLSKPRIVMTIHNIEYQGWTSVQELGKVGLHGMTYLHPERLQDNYHTQTINLLKGGISFSHWITTVSPNYASEVCTPEGGRGLDRTLQACDYKFSGILNGLDFKYWNPEDDRFLDQHYSWRRRPKTDDSITLDKKALLKRQLRERLMLEQDDSPLIACITRLVPQKGIELIKYALFRTLEKGGQFVLLGSSPIPSIDEEFHGLKQRFAQNRHVHFELHHNEELAHLIYAGSDMFIVPSIFEPCGLTQLIAMRYGSVPIVRKTGGLADTVQDVDYSELAESKTNGFVFEHPDCQGVDSALMRALHYWRMEPATWTKIQVRAMKTDHSWKSSCQDYLKVYEKLGKLSSVDARFHRRPD